MAEVFDYALVDFHPVSKIFPPPSETDLKNIEESIVKDGLLEPIRYVDGEKAGRRSIIDGRTRFRICKKHSISPKWEKVTPKPGESLAQISFALNHHRRHLTTSQKVWAAKELNKILSREAKEERKLAPKLPNGKPVEKKGKTATQAAKSFGVSERHVFNAKQIEKKAPDLGPKIESGEMTIHQANVEVRRREKREKLEKAAAEAEKTFKKNDEQGWFRLYLGDCIEVMKGEATKSSCVDLIIADPPYNIGVDYGEGTKADRMSDADYLEWCAAWLKECYRLLTDTGTFWLICNDEYAAQLKIIMEKLGFTMRSWIKWHETFGVNCTNNFNRTSRHLFYMVKNEKDFVFNQDAFKRPSDRQTKYKDKRAAAGGKLWDDVWTIPRLTGTSKERLPGFPTQLPLDLIQPIVEGTSMPGGRVLDPFSGSGTTGEACIRTKRGFAGIERSKKYWETSTLRLRAAVGEELKKKGAKPPMPVPTSGNGAAADKPPKAKKKVKKTTAVKK
jgi:site-specific DNA-methyltransferase (adenine-specific)